MLVNCFFTEEDKHIAEENTRGLGDLTEIYIFHN